MERQNERESSDGEISWRKLLQTGEKMLLEKGIADAKQDAWYLLSYAADMTREFYFLHMEEPGEKKIRLFYQRLLEKRARHVPLQYLTGTAGFMGMEFAVNKHVLIPRQDTEVLAEEALHMLCPGQRVLDLCTGSGCILLSLCKFCSIDGVGADISEDALHVAKLNGQKLNLQAVWVQSDLFENITGTFDMIVSNPPYIPTAVLDDLMPEVRLFEPRHALDGEEDGLYFYREIAREAPGYLRAGGALLLEIGYDQAEAVSELLQEAGFSEICVIKDLCGKDRVVSARCGK